ncbi:hypothetical protein HNQ94_003101 [Salirhabdus euzebyi]|uniref:Uncharacterized protein n=1 Tax=Salirhabdus euzebyi TaxID=394506 RepID=A0A841Q8K7_9BACI|nr:hypothetical protein [Salirhabdus euzebyi]MBB6454612.1 hypothetical protein [Salirhabdus euzebyi]
MKNKYLRTSLIVIGTILSVLIIYISNKDVILDIFTEDKDPYQEQMEHIKEVRENLENLNK